jgi:hypothetical protein
VGSDDRSSGGCLGRTEGDRRALPPSALNRNIAGGVDDSLNIATLDGVGVVASIWPGGKPAIFSYDGGVAGLVEGCVASLGFAADPGKIKARSPLDDRLGSGST